MLIKNLGKILTTGDGVLGEMFFAVSNEPRAESVSCDERTGSRDLDSPITDVDVLGAFFDVFFNGHN